MCSEKLTDCQRMRMRMESLGAVMRENRCINKDVFWRVLMRLHKLAIAYHDLRGDA